ncbi:MAG: exopolysaccharide biosynthesis protein [Alphaproteobacteria bacterium]|nr:exopolysaccharide biosynthesis protein [Alphaproteobacteria bacterium]
MNDEPKKPKPRRLSEIVSSFEGREGFTIGAMVDDFGERAFGALMFIFAVPNVIPAPPGTSAILGLPLVILTFQLMLGRQALWLPDRIRRRPVNPDMVNSFVRKAVPILKRFETILRPRLSLLVMSNAAERVIGVVTLLLAVVLFLPIPLVNILPAAAIACLALALAERDGFFAIVGYLLSVSTVFILFYVSTALFSAAKAFVGTLFGL